MLAQRWGQDWVQKWVQGGGQKEGPGWGQKQGPGWGQKHGPGSGSRKRGRALGAGRGMQRNAEEECRGGPGSGEVQAQDSLTKADTHIKQRHRGRCSSSAIGSMGVACDFLPCFVLPLLLLLVLFTAGTPGAHSDFGDSAGAAKLLQVRRLLIG